MNTCYLVVYNTMLHSSYWFSACLILQCSRGTYHIPPKCRLIFSSQYTTQHYIPKDNTLHHKICFVPSISAHVPCTQSKHSTYCYYPLSNRPAYLSKHLWNWGIRILCVLIHYYRISWLIHEKVIMCPVNWMNKWFIYTYIYTHTHSIDSYSVRSDCRMWNKS
jgi:hypothetical protein